MKNRLLLMVGVLILGLCAMSLAQDQPAEEQLRHGGQPTQEESDARSSVARISLIHGDVSMQRGDSGDRATVFEPAHREQRQVSTGAGSRAEVQLDHGNILRLGDNTVGRHCGPLPEPDPDRG